MLKNISQHSNNHPKEKPLKDCSLWLHAYNAFKKSGRKNRIRYQLKYFFHSLMHLKNITALKQFFDQQKLSIIVWDNPRILEKVFRSYLYQGCSKQKTLNIIQHHYQHLKQTLSYQTIYNIYSDGIRINIPQLDNSKDNEQLYLKLYYDLMFEKEGELTFALFYDNNRIYTLSFSLYGTENQTTAAFIGCIKGPNNNTPQHNQLIKKITRQYHGLRPQSLLFESLAMVLQQLQCHMVLGVTNYGHIYQSSRKLQKRVSKNYDNFWLDYQAQPFNNYCMKISLPLQRKLIDDIKSSKRSMYRKRFALLDAIKNEISQLI